MSILILIYDFLNVKAFIWIQFEKEKKLFACEKNVKMFGKEGGRFEKIYELYL
jgi:hypothetical protein